jgi:3-hydroxyisobutyrate dehydrogenase-like beta-hydroxyacid dehydrogenase
MEFDRMIEVLNASTGRNSATQDKWPRAVLPRTFDFGFATGLCLKNVRLCQQEAQDLGVSPQVGAASCSTFSSARWPATAPTRTLPS